ncbi:M16 family metallopeptidase [Mucilaginibacter sp. SJ]|uniref:M16 family metallopeptidase n=1 Tax=Mucilaginibacter sp. SJ TaxID=3029053 RepID=UPI0023A93107|nr:insulinase family protein [Mucilaginibacter sp. SJ]WEA00650.1 insulinase family protein [Mucilaginibacter sp. SJ]
MCSARDVKFCLYSKISLQNRANDPGSVFNDTVSALLGNYNIRRAGPSAAKLDRIDANRVLSIYKEIFADASNTKFVFTGSIDTSVLKPLLVNYLSALPKSAKKMSSSNLDIDIPKGEITKTVYKGTDAKSTVVLVFSGDMPYSIANRIGLDALKEVLSIRLTERLREEENGVYSPSVYATISKYPSNRYRLVVQFGCGPQNVEKLIASTLDELNKIKREGPAQINVDKWRAETFRQREVELKTNDWWLSYLNGQLQTEEDVQQLNEVPELINHITSDGLRELANKYLTGANYIRAVLLPEISN